MNYSSLPSIRIGALGSFINFPELLPTVGRRKKEIEENAFKNVVFTNIELKDERSTPVGAIPRRRKFTLNRIYLRILRTTKKTPTKPKKAT